ncbi:MAG: sodium:calcium antiporter, partial [Marinobacter sp.]
SNIFNILSVMAITAVVKPLVIDPRFGQFDLLIVLAVTFVFALFLLFVGRIGRIAGGIMAVSYLLFTFAQYSGVADAFVGVAAP